MLKGSGTNRVDLAPFTYTPDSVLLFLNKTDRIGADKHRVLTELRQKLTPDLVDLDDGFSPAVLEFLAERDDDFSKGTLRKAQRKPTE